MGTHGMKWFKVPFWGGNACTAVLGPVSYAKVRRIADSVGASPSKVVDAALRLYDEDEIEPLVAVIEEDKRLMALWRGLR